MFNWIVFGHLLNKATSFYSQGEYLLSTQFIDKALIINHQDFIVNFMRLRLAIMQRDSEVAELYVAKCQKLHPEVAETLLGPWKKTLAKLKQGDLLYQSQLNNLDLETQNELDRLQNNREINWWNSILVLAIAFFLLIVTRTVLDPPFNKMSINIVSIVCSLSLMLYYNLQTKISVNLYVRLTQYLSNMISLLQSAIFLRLIALFVLVMITGHHSKIILLYFSDFLNIFDLLTFRPVFNQLLICGFIFRPLIKYGTIPAYLITGIVSGLGGFGSGTFLQRILLTSVYLHFFDRHATMAAPISLEIIYNLIWLLTGLFMPS